MIFILRPYDPLGDGSVENLLLFFNKIKQVSSKVNLELFHEGYQINTKVICYDAIKNNVKIKNKNSEHAKCGSENNN